MLLERRARGSENIELLGVSKQLFTQ